MQKGFVGILVLIFVLIALGVGGYFVYNNLQENARTQKEINKSLKTIPTPASTSASDETANWKTYSNNTLSFKYPINLTVEERQKNYIVLLSDANNPQSVLVSIDVRQSDTYANYDKAILSTKAGLTNVRTEDMVNGVKIYGSIGPGYGEGQQITIALFKYGSAAIEAETTTTNKDQLEIFNQILSTFRFIE